MNKAFLIGNLTRDPESSTTTNGHTVCKFGLAVQRPFANASGEREADFFNIVAWRGLAETCQKWLAKGKKVAVSGRIETRTYEASDGSKRYVFEITAEDVEFLTPKSASDGEPSKHDDLEPIDDDSLPF